MNQPIESRRPLARASLEDPKRGAVLTAKDNSAFDHLPPILDVSQTAELLGLNPQVIRQYAKSGILPSYQIPGSRLFRFFRDEVVDYLRRHPVVDPESSEYLRNWQEMRAGQEEMGAE